MSKFLVSLIFICIMSSGKCPAAMHDYRRCVIDTIEITDTEQVKPSTQTTEMNIRAAYQSMDTLPEKTLEIAVLVFKEAIQKGDLSTKARVYNLMGDYYTRTRQFTRALSRFHAAANNFQLIHDTVEMIGALEKYGFINLTLDDYETARNFFFKVLNLGAMIKDPDVQGRQYLNLGMVAQDSGSYDVALKYYQLALPFFRQSGNKESEFQAKAEMGNVLLEQKRISEAILYYANLAAIADDQRIIRFKGLVLTKLGHAYSMRGDFRKSLFYNRKALEARQASGNIYDINSSLINIAGDYFKLGMKDSAMAYFEEGMRMAIKYNQLMPQINGYRHLYQYYEGVGDFKSARIYFALYSGMAAEKEAEKQRASIKISKRQDELEQRIYAGVRLEKENRIRTLVLYNQQYPFFIAAILTGLGGVVLVILTIIFFYNRKTRHKMQGVYNQLQVENRERNGKTLKIKEAEQKFRFLSENSIDFIVHFNHKMQIIYASPSCEWLYGYKPAEMLSKMPHDITHWDYHAYSDRIFQEMVAKKTEKHFMYYALRKDGSSFWVESVANPVFEPVTGDFMGVVAVIRDIHDRTLRANKIMEGTKQKENLLKEIHHRVKNNFAILVSLINMQIAQHKDPVLKASLTNLQLRIRSMSLVHEMLYRSDDFEKISVSDYIRSLASVVAATMNNRKIRLSVEVANGIMNIDTAIPVGLILTEVITNSYLHAFTGREEGSILVRFSELEEFGHYRLVLSDNGVGLPENFKLETVQTMGLQIVQLLCRQIDSTLTITSENGATFTIDFALPVS